MRPCSAAQRYRVATSHTLLTSGEIDGYGGRVVVTFAQLRDAQPELWQTAADDLLAAAKQSERTATRCRTQLTLLSGS